MKRFLFLAAALVATASFGISQASADGYGSGCNNHQYGYNFNRSGFERPPYFALFPPVYYADQIVRRPYGVSPFAATPGVLPVEMSIPATPLTVKNPYFNPESAKVSDKKIDTDT